MKTCENLKAVVFANTFRSHIRDAHQKKVKRQCSSKRSTKITAAVELEKNYPSSTSDDLIVLRRLVALNAIRSSEVLDMNPSNSLDVMDSKKIVDGRWFFRLPLHTVDRLQCFQKFQLFPTFNEKICIHM